MILLISTRIMLIGSIEYNSYTKSNGELVDSTRIVPGWCLTLVSKSSSSHMSSDYVFHNEDILCDIIGDKSAVFLKHYKSRSETQVTFASHVEKFVLKKVHKRLLLTESFIIFSWQEHAVPNPVLF